MLTPRPYQQEGVKFLLEAEGGAVLADPQGTGKTLEAVWAASELEGPVLIISRPLNMYFWKQVIKELDPGAPVVTAKAGLGGVFNSEKVASWFGATRTHGYLIIYHEMLPYSVDHFSVAKNGKQAKFRPAKFSLKDFGVWDAIIADEAHRFKNRKSQTTKALKRIPCYRRWPMTGTAMEKSPADLWSLLHWFDKDLFSSYWTFFDMFVEYEDAPFGGREITGVKNRPLLAQTIAPFYLRRSKFPGMPPQDYKNVPLLFSLEQKLLYDSVRMKTFVELSETGEETFIKNALARQHLLQRIAVDPSLVDSNVHSVKVQWLLDWLEDYGSTQFVVFTHIKKFANGLPLLIPNGAAITGDVAQDDREAALHDFQTGALQFLSCTIDVAAESINLPQAEFVFVTDMHRSSILQAQAEERAHRMDSPKPTHVVRLLAKGTVDFLALDAYERKLSNAEVVHQFLQYLRDTKID